MEPEASSFETSEILATFVASTPVLEESWRLCNLANSVPNQGFVMEQVGNIGYVGFPSMGNNQICYGNLVALDGENNQIFSPLYRQINEGEKPIMLEAGFLQLFFSIYGFQTQILALMEKSKSIVMTGHSIGGTTASLSTLWLLSYLHSLIPSPLSVLCITFGSPMLGNDSLSKAILRQRWDGNFCHVVSKLDIFPRLFFLPPLHISPCLQLLLNLWRFFETSRALAVQLHNEEKVKMFQSVLGCLEKIVQSEGGSADSLFWPFGNYFFCTGEGAICMDNAVSVIKMMHLMLMTSGSPDSSIEDHLKYGNYVARVSSQFLKQRSFMGDLPGSCYEAGAALALQSLGMASQESVAVPAKDCLKRERKMVRTPNLNVANLAIKLSKINPYRAQIEWYKALCDDSDDEMGYYDSFKRRGNSRRDSKVNLNRMMLGGFWDNVISMIESNEVPHDFHKRAKWVNASQFYKLLVEPLDIAEYYRTGMHRVKGHYIEHGRERRYKIFDRWWEERRVTDAECYRRSTYASLTQDTCFWAKLEEAREWLDNVRSERDKRKRDLLWNNINDFESYAAGLVDSKQVSKDVLAKNSSYTLWLEELREFKSQLIQVSV
ncbi:hypothetical protein Pint_27435 [Pistacia integerrima]|uniref:Uncharacterized protein n=1 Tax=Pistacia integerrima TaxID=434235 RepID=A0ACC0YS40_9ROSI|nr:hypothetical protein Pint_27435 [Pistacia integerrima]